MDRRLYRSRDNQMIAGVCSGLGKYIGVDPTVIRIIFVLLALLGGAGLPLYLAMMIIVPMEPQDGETSALVDEEPAAQQEEETAGD